MRLNCSRGLRALVFVLLFALFGAGTSAFAQMTYGSLTGQVTDATGASVIGAAVTFTNVDTNFPQTTRTDGSGVYAFKLVSAGNYSLRVSSANFAEYVQNGIVIAAQQYATQNVQLAVAKTGSTVTVTANAELIDTTTPELGMTVNQQSTTDLPLDGRDPSSLALLAPGIVNGTMNIGWQQSGFSFPDESVASSNGGRLGSTYYMLDGVSNMDNYLESNSPTPNPDAVEQFRLISSNFSAVYGFSLGGVVSMATRSGSNTWHGGLFEFMRNGDFDAPNWSNHQQDAYRQNQYGGYVGGPAIKNKLFFFFNYQGTVVVGGPGQSNNSTTTPTAQMLNGDFSGMVTYNQANNTGKCGAPGTQVPAANLQGCGVLNGPFASSVSNGVYLYNQLVGSLDPVAVEITKDGLPGHTAPATGTAPPTSGSQNLAGQMLYGSAALKNTKFNQYTARADYDLTKSQRLTVRSFVDKWVQPAGDTPGDVLSVLNLNTWNQTFGIQGYYFNELMQHTWTVNSNTVNTISALWTQQSVHNGTQVNDTSGKPMCWSRYIAINEPVCYMEGAGFGGSNGGWTEPSDEIRGVAGLSDTLIKTIHRHTLSMGIDVNHQRSVEDASNYPADAVISFGGGYTGQGLADWLLGYMSSFLQGAGELADIQGWQVDPYVNDEFRIKPGLTLTLGVRWDPDLAPVSVGGRGTAFVPGQQSLIFPAAPSGLIYPGDQGMDSGLRPSDKRFVEPRVGVAYQPKNLPHTAFHLGFGLFSAPVAYSDYNHVVDMAPFAPTIAPYNPSNSPICSGGSSESSTCTPNTGQSVAGYMNFHNPYQTSTFNTPSGQDPFPGTIPWATPTYKPPYNSPVATPVTLGASFSRNFKSSMTQAWNFSVEQQLNNVTALRVAYVGSESYHQNYVQDDNDAAYSYCTYYNNPTCALPTSANKTNGSLKAPGAPYSNFTQILEYDSGATAHYNSLQVTVQRSMAHGLQAQTAFTWAKSMDAATVANIANGDEINDPKNLGWSRGISNANVPFTWVSNFIARSPELKGQNLIVREALGGWELSPIVTWQSGAPFNIGGGNSQSAYGELNYGSGCLSACGGDRADRVPGQPLKIRQGGRGNWTKMYFNPDAFVTRHDGTFGNSARNLIQGPPGFNVDAAMMKNFSILERYQLQFRFEFFNAFNHPVMGNPDTTPTDSCFGEINCYNGGFGSETNPPRIGQAALKLTF